MATKKKRAFHAQRTKRSKTEADEIAALERAIVEQAPPLGTNPLSASGGASGKGAAARTFEALPISSYTKAALKEAKLETLTAIQRAVLPHALAGRDILGAAKTGSGKTISFLIPVR